MCSIKSFLLCETDESVILLPPSRAHDVQALVINRSDGDVSLVPSAHLSESCFQSCLTCSLFLGIFKFLACSYVVVGVERTAVARLEGQTIWRLQKVNFIPLQIGGLISMLEAGNISEDQAKDEKSFVRLLTDLFENPGGFYFSYDRNMTLTSQRLHDLSESLGEDPSSLYNTKCNDLFFWNKPFLPPQFFEDERFAPWRLPLIYGFVQQATCQVNNEPFDFTLISRRSCRRPGTRFNARGSDLAGNVANFVETEQIISREEENELVSLVLIRGSIPVLWQQPTGFEYHPKPVPEAALWMSLEVCRTHFQLLHELYGPVVVLDLVDHTGGEAVMSDYFQRAVELSGVGGVKLFQFDFHRECKNMRYDRLNLLLNQFTDEVESYCYFHRRAGKRQTGVVRVNCMDCLDRTNVCESQVAFRSLERQLRHVGVLYDEDLTSHTDFMRQFKDVWANNADAISYQYTGTGALKNDYTRTGKRGWMGMVSDGISSVKRYYINHFLDEMRQDGLDYLGSNVAFAITNSESPGYDAVKVSTGGDNRPGLLLVLHTSERVEFHSDDNVRWSYRLSGLTRIELALSDHRTVRLHFDPALRRHEYPAVFRLATPLAREAFCKEVLSHCSHANLPHTRSLCPPRGGELSVHATSYFVEPEGLSSSQLGSLPKDQDLYLIALTDATGGPHSRPLRSPEAGYSAMTTTEGGWVKTIERQLALLHTPTLTSARPTGKRPTVGATLPPRLALAHRGFGALTVLVFARPELLDRIDDIQTRERRERVDYAGRRWLTSAVSCAFRCDESSFMFTLVGLPKAPSAVKTEALWVRWEERMETLLRRSLRHVRKAMGRFGEDNDFDYAVVCTTVLESEDALGRPQQNPSYDPESSLRATSAKGESSVDSSAEGSKPYSADTHTHPQGQSQGQAQRKGSGDSVGSGSTPKMTRVPSQAPSEGDTQSQAHSMLSTEPTISDGSDDEDNVISDDSGDGGSDVASRKTGSLTPDWGANGGMRRVQQKSIDERRTPCFVYIPGLRNGSVMHGSWRYPAVTPVSLPGCETDCPTRLYIFSLEDAMSEIPDSAPELPQSEGVCKSVLCRVRGFDRSQEVEYRPVRLRLSSLEAESWLMGRSEGVSMYLTFDSPVLLSSAQTSKSSSVGLAPKNMRSPKPRSRSTIDLGGFATGGAARSVEGTGAAHATAGQNPESVRAPEEREHSGSTPAGTTSGGSAAKESGTAVPTSASATNLKAASTTTPQAPKATTSSAAASTKSTVSVTKPPGAAASTTILPDNDDDDDDDDDCGDDDDSCGGGGGRSRGRRPSGEGAAGGFLRLRPTSQGSVDEKDPGSPGGLRGIMSPLRRRPGNSDGEGQASAAGAADQAASQRQRRRREARSHWLRWTDEVPLIPYVTSPDALADYHILIRLWMTHPKSPSSIFLGQGVMRLDSCLSGRVLEGEASDNPAVLHYPDDNTQFSIPLSYRGIQLGEVRGWCALDLLPGQEIAMLAQSPAAQQGLFKLRPELPKTGIRLEVPNAATQVQSQVQNLKTQVQGLTERVKQSQHGKKVMAQGKKVSEKVSKFFGFPGRRSPSTSTPHIVVEGDARSKARSKSEQVPSTTDMSPDSAPPVVPDVIPEDGTCAIDDLPSCHPQEGQPQPRTQPGRAGEAALAESSVSSTDTASLAAADGIGGDDDLLGSAARRRSFRRRSIDSKHFVLGRPSYDDLRHANIALYAEGSGGGENGQTSVADEPLPAGNE
eukprot:Rmarinus@m.11307